MKLDSATVHRLLSEYIDELIKSRRDQSPGRLTTGELNAFALGYVETMLVQSLVGTDSDRRRMLDELGWDEDV